MKITGPGAPAAPSASGAARARGGGFSVGGAPAASGASAVTAASSAAGVVGVSALMALQGVEDATERRRRAVRRGGGLLDRLDELKLALLAGDAGAPALARLSRSLAEDRPADLEPGLKDVLDQIDLRAAVELAKAEVARG